MFHILRLTGSKDKTYNNLNRAIVIGGFDGIHLGHQALIGKLIAIANERSLSSSLIIIEPHAHEYFAEKQDQQAIPRIMSITQKIYKIIDLQQQNPSFQKLCEIIILPFNHNIAQLTAKDFTQIIANKLNTKFWLMGQDFHFGKDRLGSVDFLKQQSINFEIDILEDVNNKNQQRYSSTQIRNSLLNGDLKSARDALGEDYCLIGRVQPGRGLARNLLAPTANIHFKYPPPVRGVFAGYCKILPGIDTYPAIINIGRRPTIENHGVIKLEVHLLIDQDLNLYQQRIKVIFTHKIRNEIKFANHQHLQNQIAEDIKIARRALKI